MALITVPVSGMRQPISFLFRALRGYDVAPAGSAFKLALPDLSRVQVQLQGQTLRLSPLTAQSELQYQGTFLPVTVTAGSVSISLRNSPLQRILDGEPCVVSPDLSLVFAAGQAMPEVQLTKNEVTLIWKRENAVSIRWRGYTGYLQRLRITPTHGYVSATGIPQWLTPALVWQDAAVSRATADIPMSEPQIVDWLVSEGRQTKYRKQVTSRTAQAAVSAVERVLQENPNLTLALASTPRGERVARRRQLCDLAMPIAQKELKMAAPVLFGSLLGLVAWAFLSWLIQRLLDRYFDRPFDSPTFCQLSQQSTPYRRRAPRRRR